MKVKLLRIYGESSDYDSYKEILEDSTQWEEVSEEDAQEIEKAIQYKNSKYNGYKFVLVYDSPIRNSAFSTLSFVQQAKAEQEAERKANEKYLKEKKRIAEEKDRKNKANKEASLLKRKQKLEEELAKLSSL